MKVGLAFNLRKDSLPEGAPDVSSAEYYSECDSIETILAIRDALSEHHDVTLLEADETFYTAVRDARPDIVFNFAEGLWGAARESQIPAMLEMLRIPYTGSDPSTLAICLDKFRTKEVLGFHGLRSARGVLIPPSTPALVELPFPLVVKPLAEGSSKGVRKSSYVRDAHALQRECERVHRTTLRPALVEEFLPGCEFTVAMLGNNESLTCLPVIEICLDRLPAGTHLYSFEPKWEWDTTSAPLEIFECPAKLSPELNTRIELLCRKAWNVLGLRDWARIDLRLDAEGEPAVIEVNPIPGALPDPREHSAFPMAARAAGIAFPQLIQAVLNTAAERINAAHAHCIHA